MQAVARNVGELASVAGGEVIGDDSLLIHGAGEARHAGCGQITYATSEKYVGEALEAGASCVVLSRGLVDSYGPGDELRLRARKSGVSLILVDEARLAFAKILAALYPRRALVPGVHPTAVIHAEASLGEDASLEPHVVVEEGARIGRRCALAAGCYVGREVEMGDDCHLGPYVVLYEGVKLGSRVNLEAGTVVGSQGFGWTPADGCYAGVPQVGTVIIEDDVNIGANVTIDRATLGETRIGQGTKIDNLVHVAHNVRIGEHCAISGQVGIAGSSTLGDWVILAGQVGVADHVVIGDHVIVGAKSGISSRKVVHANQTIWGIPARELKKAKRQAATLARLSKARDR
jgi:UDP-3-O-[3-hydroxymyristoyl] glucosamine N-acyltransferase